MIWLRIGSESILSHFVWYAKLRYSFRFSKSQKELSRICGSSNIKTIAFLYPRHFFIKTSKVWGISWWKMPIFIICVSFWRRDSLDLWMFSCWQLATLIICVRFRRGVVLDLLILSSEVDYVIVKMLSSSTPSRSVVVKTYQGRGMSWWKWANLIRCVGFRKLDGSDL